MSLAFRGQRPPSTSSKTARLYVALPLLSLAAICTTLLIHARRSQAPHNLLLAGPLLACVWITVAPAAFAVAAANSGSRDDVPARRMGYGFWATLWVAFLVGSYLLVVAQSRMSVWAWLLSAFVFERASFRLYSGGSVNPFSVLLFRTAARRLFASRGDRIGATVLVRRAASATLFVHMLFVLTWSVLFERVLWGEHPYVGALVLVPSLFFVSKVLKTGLSIVLVAWTYHLVANSDDDESAPSPTLVVNVLVRRVFCDADVLGAIVKSSVFESPTYAYKALKARSFHVLASPEHLVALALSGDVDNLGPILVQDLEQNSFLMLEALAVMSGVAVAFLAGSASRGPLGLNLAGFFVAGYCTFSIAVEVVRGGLFALLLLYAYDPARLQLVEPIVGSHLSRVDEERELEGGGYGRVRIATQDDSSEDDDDSSEEPNDDVDEPGDQV